MSLFQVTENDKRIYEEEIKDFLPPKMIDIHTHVYKKENQSQAPVTNKRTVTWPSLVAPDNPLEDLQETYRLLFPEQDVSALMFASLKPNDSQELANQYVSDSAKASGWPALYYSIPTESGPELEKNILAGGFLGVKSYLNLSPRYLPEAEIRIYDFFPHEQLEILDKNGWIVMLHIPRHGRLKDPVNIAQIIEITQKYPNIKLIIAHVGRAYCQEDVGEAFEQLSVCPNLLFDFCANTNQQVFEQLIKSVGPKRILFGSDMPILRMRTRRICENGTYINLVPPGLYGDPSQDSHLREVSEEEAESITFFMYEEILAMKRAAQACGLSREDVADMFYNNAKQLIDEVRQGR